MLLPRRKLQFHGTINNRQNAKEFQISNEIVFTKKYNFLFDFI